MRHKKNKLLLIVIILVIILILLIGVSIAYFTTDIFKGNKQLFFKYASQMVDEKDGLISQNLINYFEKQQNTPYKTDGSISVNIDSSEEKYDNVNNMELTFSGQADIANSKSEQNISLNYSDDVNFPLIYRQIGSTIGIQTDYIGSKFISTSNLSGVFSGNSSTSSSLSSSTIEQVENLPNLSLSEEELEHIKDTYLATLNEQLKETNFTKIEGTDTTGYALTLTVQEFKDILLAMLQTLRNDQVTLAKLNEYLQNQENASSITTSDIDRTIQSFEQAQVNPEDNSKIAIIVYQKNKKITGLELKVDDATIAQITKKNENDQLEYNIEVQAETKIGVNLKFTGLQDMQTVGENFTISIEMEENNYQYNYSNNVQFIDSSNIEEFSEENSLNLDNLDGGAKITLLQAIVERIQMVNASQMQELGLQESENPLQYIMPSTNTYTNSMDIIENNSLNEAEIAAFNSGFEIYAGSNVRGTTVRGLLSIISANNGLEEEEDGQNNQEASNNLIEEIHFDGAEYEVNGQNITLIKSSIETDSYYRVEFEKEENTGRIYRVVINKK